MKPSSKLCVVCWPLTLLYCNFDAFDAKSKYSSQSRSKLSGRIRVILIYRITYFLSCQHTKNSRIFI